MDETPVAPERANTTGRLGRRLLVALAFVAVLVVTGWIGYGLTRPPPWQRSGPPITVHAWAPFWQTDSALTSFSANADVFSDLSLFAFHATAADRVGPYDGLGSGVQATYRQATAAAGVALTASIIDDTGKGVMASILADPASRALHIQTIMQLATGVDGSGLDGFDGIDLDYETFAFVDGRETWATTSPNWVLFVQELAVALHQTGKTLTVSVPPMYDTDRTGGDRGYWVYDYPAMGEVVDFIRIMAYDYNTSEAGPIAPIGWVSDLVGDIKEMVPPEKLILGVPVYGYNWPTSILGICPADQEPRRQNQSTKSATALAASLGIVPTFDPRYAESTFIYNEQLTGTDAAGLATACTVTRTVWFADSRAVFERAWLAERQDLAGIAIWSLGSDDELVWQAIDAARSDLETWPPETTPPDTTSPDTTLPATTSAATFAAG